MHAITGRVLTAAMLTYACACSAPGAGKVSPTDKGRTSAGAGIPSVADCDLCPPLVRIPPIKSGGSPLYIARHELTWREYLPAVTEAGCKLPELGGRRSYPPDLSSLADNYPVNFVAPNDFGCYLDWISRKTGQRYRLPTAEEWEHAARAGASTKFPWGNELGYGNAAVWERFDPDLLKPFEEIDRDPRYAIGVGRIALPVESFRPNAWGLYDVVGNVAEYVADQVPGPGTCLAIKNAAFCRLQVSRGGKTTTISYRVGVGMVGYDYDFLNEEEKWFAGAAQPPGYRIIRE